MHSNQSHLAVKYFLDNFPLDVMISNAKPSNKKEELAQLYLGRLSEVLGVFHRLIRYEKYFEFFYPPTETGISESEAIEYHLRAYIEDFFILQERVRKITKHLIEDLPNYDIQNPDDVEKVLSYLSDQIHEKFKKITADLRREHVHERSISEIDLVTGKFLNSIISGETPIPENMQLNQTLIKNRHDEVLNKMKIKYVNQSKQNSVSLEKIQDWFCARFIHIFSSINGHKIEGLSMDME